MLGLKNLSGMVRQDNANQTVCKTVNRLLKINIMVLRIAQL